MDKLVLLIAALLPFERLGAITLGGINIRPSQIVLLAALVVASRMALHGRLHFPKQLAACGLWLAAFFAVASLSLFNSENFSRSLLVLAFTAFTATLAWLLPAFVNLLQVHQIDESFFPRVRNVILLSAAVVGVFGLWQFFADMSGAPAWLTGLKPAYMKSILGFTRVQSTALEPLYFADYLLLPMGLAIAWLVSGAPRKTAIRLYALLAVLFANLLLTASRGGYAGFAAMILAIAWMERRRLAVMRRMLVASILGAVAVVVGLFMLGNVFLTHVSTLTDGAGVVERQETFRGALDAFALHPFIGVGIGGYGPFVSTSADIRPDAGWPIVNNQILELLAETGLLGLLAFAGFVIMVLKRGSQESDPGTNVIRIGALAAFIGILVQYQTFSTLYVMHVWFTIGLILAISARRENH